MPSLLIRHLVFCAGLMLAALAGPDPAAAQSCTSDAQCGASARGFNSCLGDTLITRRRICVGGSCQEQETGRQSCGSGGCDAAAGRCAPANIGGAGGLAGTCEGNTFVRSGARIACVKTCACKGNTLTISTGVCSPGLGCGRTTVRCQKGCTCAPEARCLEDPIPVRPRASGAATIPPSAGSPAPLRRLVEPAPPTPRASRKRGKAKAKATRAYGPPRRLLE